jgi:GTP-binding protein
MPVRLAIVGRPNVGKSTLFNRLTGRRRALVDDQPGVTRDRRYGKGHLGPIEIEVIDTAGFEEATGDTLEARMRRQTELAVADADIVLLLIDAREGATPLDRHFANWLRRQPKPVLLVANKAESRAAVPGIAEGHRLGFGEPIAVSAEHAEGMADLADRVIERLGLAEPEAKDENAPRRGSRRSEARQRQQAKEQAAVETEAGADREEGGAELPEDDPDRPLQLAIVGRPNVGKSTLVNRLLGEERLLVGPEAGITRDSIAIDWHFRGRKLRLVDTAGLWRRARITDKVERLSVGDTLETIRFAEVAILVLDATVMLEKQDLAVASLVAEEGRAMVIAANKWDLVEDKPAALRKLTDRLEISLPQVKGLPVLPVSAQSGQNLDRLIEAAIGAHAAWNRRIPTGDLNRWLAAATQNHPAPIVSGRRLRPRYITQIKTRPPTFALFMNRPEALPEAYQRYLVNGIRERFDLPGVPIRFTLRGGKNPYATRD